MKIFSFKSEITNFILKKNFKNIFNFVNRNLHNVNKINKIQFTFNQNKILIKTIRKNFSGAENHKLDPYLILEVNRGADFKMIKAAYFKLARLYHPDTNKNDEVKKYFI